MSCSSPSFVIAKNRTVLVLFLAPFVVVDINHKTFINHAYFEFQFVRILRTPNSCSIAKSARATRHHDHIIVANVSFIPFYGIESF